MPSVEGGCSQLGRISVDPFRTNQLPQVFLDVCRQRELLHDGPGTTGKHCAHATLNSRRCLTSQELSHSKQLADPQLRPAMESPRYRDICKAANCQPNKVLTMRLFSHTSVKEVSRTEQTCKVLGVADDHIVANLSVTDFASLSSSGHRIECWRFKVRIFASMVGQSYWASRARSWMQGLEHDEMMPDAGSRCLEGIQLRQQQ